MSTPLGKTLLPAHYGILFYTKSQKGFKFNELRSPHKKCSHCNEMIKDYGGKKNQITRRLKPDQLERAIDLAETAGIATGILTGNLNLLTKVLGSVGGRALATELLINPRLQNLSNQMLQAASRNQSAILKKLNDSFINELEKKHPDLAEKLRKKSSDGP